MTNQLELNYLSYRFSFKYRKYVVILISTLLNAYLIYLIIRNFKFIESNKALVIIFLLLGTLLCSIFNYYLFASKTIKYNSHQLLIERSSKKLEEVLMANIVKIKRFIYYFYTLTYRDAINNIQNVKFFISPNPPIGRSKEVNDILKQIDRKDM